MNKVGGRIAARGTVNGDVTAKGKMSGTLKYAKNKPLPWYEGEYEITPKWEDTVLETNQKSMHDDVTVKEIPYLEADNPQGGVTVVIGGF